MWKMELIGRAVNYNVCGSLQGENKFPGEALTAQKVKTEKIKSFEYQKETSSYIIFLL